MSKYRVPVLETFSWQEPVLRRDLYEAPLASKGNRYLVPKDGITPGNIWEGHENDIAWFDGLNWKFDSPENGWHIYVKVKRILIDGMVLNGSLLKELLLLLLVFMLIKTELMCILKMDRLLSHLELSKVPLIKLYLMKIMM